MTEKDLLSLLLIFCTKTNDLNYTHKEVVTARIKCVSTLSKCSIDEKTQKFSYKKFLTDCEESVKHIVLR
jgi:hypothetical protein